MALLKPTLLAVPAWDVATGYTFTFTVPSGSDQVTANTLYIRNNTTNEVVYTNAVTSFKLENTVPPNVAALTNGTYYNAYIVTENASGQLSPASNIIQFFCYSTPSFAFSNITPGGVWDSAQLNATVTYDQDEGELLNSYTMTLYNTAQVQIATSGPQFVGSTTPPPTDVSFLFSGLDDNTTYYISATGITVNNTQITTGFVQFTVQYVQPGAFGVLELMNNCEDGYITVQSNAVLIEGTSNPSPPTYIADEEIDLRGTGYWVKWGDGFNINGDFTAKLWFRDANLNTELLNFSNISQQKVTLRYMADYEDSTKVYVDLISDSGYYIYSASISAPSAQEIVCAQIRRINDIYELILQEVT